MWETSGDGSFVDATILDAVYTPGTNDVINGEVNLTLTIVDGDGVEMSDEMLLTFKPAPNAPDMPVGPDYVDVFKVLETSYSTSVVEGATGYNWELLPENAGEIISDDNEATVYWNPDYLGDATLKVAALSECGQGDFSEDLNIFVDNTVGIDKMDSSIEIGISPNPNNGAFRLTVKTKEGNDINVKMINYLGALVFELNDIQTSTGFVYNFENHDLPAGVYLVSISKGEKIYSKKIVIN